MSRGRSRTTHGGVPLLSMAIWLGGTICAGAADLPEAAGRLHHGSASAVACREAAPAIEQQPGRPEAIGDPTRSAWSRFPARPAIALADSTIVVPRPQRRWWMRPDPRQWPQVFAYYATHTFNPASTGFRHWFE